MSDTAPRATTINIEALPQTSALLSALLKQLQLAALFIAHFETHPREPEDSFQDRFGLRPALLDSLFAALEMYLPGKVAAAELPAISNRARWSNPKKLGGYLSVKPNELLASYSGCWQQATQYPNSTAFRFIRLAFWYWRESNDLFAALGLLFDLYKAGFFLRSDHFLAAAWPVCEAYTRNFDIDSLKHHDFDSEDGDKALLGMISSLSERSLDNDNVRILFDWVADCSFEEAESARQAESADEWLFRQASLRIAVELLSSLELEYRSVLTGPQRAIESQFEEVRADLGGQANVALLVAKDGRPLKVKFHGIGVVGLEYQRLYPTDWLDKLMEDRILAPEALRGYIEETYAGVTLPAALDPRVPREWEIVSEWIAWSLCTAFQRDPVLARSRDFEIDRINQTCRDLGYSPEADPVFNEFSDTAMAAARRQLALDEVRTLLEDPELFGDDAATAIAKLEAILELYPWNNLARRELGIRYDQSERVAEAFSQLRAAVLLDPTEAMSWQSLSVVLNRLGEPSDATFAAAVSQMISQKESE